MSEVPVEVVPSGRITRNRVKQQREEAGLPAEEAVPAKKKHQTLGQYLADEREKIVEQLETQEDIHQFEVYQDYDKDLVLQQMQAVEIESFAQQLYQAPVNGAAESGPKILFLTLQTGPNPKTYSHFCNNSTLKWNIRDLKLPYGREVGLGALPNCWMVFVRGAFVEGTSLDGHIYKYLGLVGLQSYSSGRDPLLPFDPHAATLWLEVTLCFDYALGKKELAMFGDNVIRCKKNKYGSSLCG